MNWRFWRWNQARPPLAQPAAAGAASRGDDSMPATELLSHLEEGVVVISGSKLQWHNPAAVRIFPGLEGGRGRSVIEVLRDHRIDGLAAKARLNGLEEAAEIELPVSRRIVYARAIPFKTDGVMLLLSDLTRFRYLETVRQQFVANLAHEMRTPLAGLDLAAQTLAGDLPPDGDARAFLDRIFQESQRLQAMVANLSQLAALDEDGIEVERMPFDVVALVNGLVLRNQARAVQQGLRLRGDVTALRPGLQALGDQAKTDQALQNITDNALKFTRAGEVVVSARGDDGRVEIAVRDTGPGIPPNDLPRIFERFYKVDRSRGGHAGSGLGLSIARHLIELQGGTITAQSTPNVGTEMRVRLPAA